MCPVGLGTEYWLNRVGFWRLLTRYSTRFRLPGTLAVNGCAIAAYEAIARAAHDRAWEFYGSRLRPTEYAEGGRRGRGHRPHRRVIAQCHRPIARARLVGITASPKPGNAGLARGKGVTAEYVCDWVLDDQPVLLNTRGPGPILSVPYTRECNDVGDDADPGIHGPPARLTRAIDQFEQLRQDARKIPARVMAMVIHPYIMGAHRLEYFRKAIERIRNSGDAPALDWRTNRRLVSGARAAHCQMTGM